jgi:hypothetical protein
MYGMFGSIKEFIFGIDVDRLDIDMIIANKMCDIFITAKMIPSCTTEEAVIKLKLASMVRAGFERG